MKITINKSRAHYNQIKGSLSIRMITIFIYKKEFALLKLIGYMTCTGKKEGKRRFTLLKSIGYMTRTGKKEGIR